MFDGAKKMLMTPMLEQEVVVDATWKEMLREAPFLLIPWTAKLNKVLSGILPVGIRDFVLDKAGVYHSMEEFQGHTTSSRRDGRRDRAQVPRRRGRLAIRRVLVHTDRAGLPGVHPR